jgi:HEAT repeat protein
MQSMPDQEMREMLIDYMGKGFLENIIALFKQDPSLYRFVADMMAADNIRVRLGATALIEDLVIVHRQEIRTAVPGLIALLKHQNPTIRGDAASALGIIRDLSAETALRNALGDEHPGVREAAQEALQDMEYDRSPQGAQRKAGIQ